MALSISYPVKVPRWVVTYKGVDITLDISPMLTAITYTDQLGSSAGSLELDLEDHQKFWQGPWYPRQGDEVDVLIGYTGDELLPCGNFQIDELELSGPPDHFTMRCLAAWITPAMRTRHSVGYEGQALPQIAATIAAKYGLTVVGAVNDRNVSFARITQCRETDLEFLARLARAHNYEFTIRGTQLVFYAMAALETAAPVLTLSREDLLGFSFLNKTHLTYKAGELSYQALAYKQLIAQSVAPSATGSTGDILKCIERCENGQQAALKAQSALHEMNKSALTVRLSAPGNPELSAGNVLAISGFGVSDGNYLVETARHRLSRDRGFTSDVTARSVGAA